MCVVGKSLLLDLAAGRWSVQCVFINSAELGGKQVLWVELGADRGTCRDTFDTLVGDNVKCDQLDQNIQYSKKFRANIVAAI